MAQDTYSTLKLKIEKEIAKLQKKAQDLQAKRRNPVIASIIRSMREYGITPQEIATAYNKGPGKTATVRKPESKPSAKRVVPVKYRHPQTGESWTGRGKAPRWISAAEAAGEKRESFLIS